jgi:alkanesulfonate monooxygenase SsuD/methylene tetrahydromethanopterin reductase-like flavin-dependent oxidoreductase (luciferase family)
MAARKEWGEMPLQITDEMLEHFCVITTAENVAGAIKSRYTGLLDRITLYTPFEPGADDTKWQTLVRAFKA